MKFTRSDNLYLQHGRKFAIVRWLASWGNRAGGTTLRTYHRYEVMIISGVEFMYRSSPWSSKNVFEIWCSWYEHTHRTLGCDGAQSLLSCWRGFLCMRMLGKTDLLRQSDPLRFLWWLPRLNLLSTLHSRWFVILLRSTSNLQSPLDEA